MANWAVLSDLPSGDDRFHRQSSRNNELIFQQSQFVREHKMTGFSIQMSLQVSIPAIRGLRLPCTISFRPSNPPSYTFIHRLHPSLIGLNLKPFLMLCTACLTLPLHLLLLQF